MTLDEFLIDDSINNDLLVEKTMKKHLNKTYKVVVAGDGAVGKTTISQRITGVLQEEEERFMTRGVDFHSLQVIDENLNTMQAQIWDLGGQEQFRIFQKPFFAEDLLRI